MKRETITIPEKIHSQLMCDEVGYLDGNEDWNNPDFRLISLTTDEVDYGKGIGDLEFIILRISDNKYFKGECKEHSEGYMSFDEAYGYTRHSEYKLKEVFQKAVTTYIYE